MSTIVVATDLVPGPTPVVDVAIDLARRLGARLLILHVMDLGRLTGRGRHDRIDQARAEREPVLLDLVRDARSAGVAAEFLLWAGAPVDTITDAVVSEGADMLVIGARRRRRAGRLLLGSVTDELVRRTDMPVLVVPTMGASAASLAAAAGAAGTTSMDGAMGAEAGSTSQT
ncbi:MAG: universal stress protein [Chloroflexi bacterium]|nr:universal stress protein [Chloroflexota bacterium]